MFEIKDKFYPDGKEFQIISGAFQDSSRILARQARKACKYRLQYRRDLYPMEFSRACKGRISLGGYARCLQIYRNGSGAWIVHYNKTLAVYLLRMGVWRTSRMAA